MTEQTICPECGSEWRAGLTCDDHFNQMLAWDFENRADAWSVHHLTVLCFHIQHPSRYSPAGLQGALELLNDAVNKGIPADKLRQKLSAIADSSVRTTPITNHGIPGSHGRLIAWPLMAADMTKDGVDVYCERVKAWARSILGKLEAVQ